MVFSVILSACAAEAVNQPQSAAPGPMVQNEAVTPAAATPVIESSDAGQAEHHSDVDLTHLELGDGKVSSSPQVGYVYSCITQFNGGSAQGTGSWMNGDGTWDATKKITVDGSVTWPASFTITVQGNQRVFTGNDLPDHPTGNYPIAASDDAYAVDRNPNSIQAKSLTFSVPANPAAAAQPVCVGGEVGIMLSGVVIFSAFDAEGRDAVAHEVQDDCDGHPQNTGFYHYHSLSDCLEDTSAGHSALMGYAFDGFGIFGYYGEEGKELTNQDLDVCHGHTHLVEWDGQMVEMYHYHATHEFPYVVGCFHGTPAVRALSGEANGQQGQPGQGQPSQGGGQGSDRQPPQEAIDACASLAVNAACSFGASNGTISGTCQMPPGSSQLACVPAGGPPGP